MNSPFAPLIFGAISLIVLVAFGILPFEQVPTICLSILWLSGALVALKTNLWMGLAAVFIPILAVIIIIGSLATGTNFAEHLLTIFRR
jgi:hypothetical protein